MNKQEASLLLMKKIMVPKSEETDRVSIEHVATFNANLMSLGFVLSPDVVEACVKNLAESKFDIWSKELSELLIKYNGSRNNMKPMYPNFPQQVMKMDERELFLNALIHYITNGEWTPKYKEVIKLRTESILAPKVIGLTNDNELMSYAKKLAEMPISMSEQQKEILTFLLNMYPEEISFNGPFNMTNKENMAFTIHCISKSSYVVYKTWKDVLAEKNIHTITDILRLAAVFLGEDASLTEHNRFTSIKRSDRRFLLSLINNYYRDNVYQAVEDAARYQNLWKIVLEQLHPGDYKNKYIYAYQFAVKVREDKLRTWYSKLEKAYSENNLRKVIPMLKRRPGEFARRLERTVRVAINNVQDTNSDTIDAVTVIKEFASIANQVDKTILLQLDAYFANKASGNPSANVRTFFPKGQMSKVYVVEEDRTEINPFLYAMCRSACMNALIDIYADREKLGNVYIDPKVGDFTVPLKLRNASNQLQTISRGSRMRLPENTNVLRLYTWWKNISESYNGRVDIDLSATFYDENFDKAMNEIYYRNLREEGCCHSGDIVTAPNGAAEFINIDIETLLQKGVRYIAMSINSFNHVDFCDMPECFAGVMAIDEVEDREPTFDPAKSFIRSDISTASTACIPMVFDLVTKEVIWVDSVVPHDNFVNNVAHCKGSMANLVRGIICASYPTLDDLIILNIVARNGKLVNDKEEADIIFSLDEGITPFDLEIINSEWV